MWKSEKVRIAIIDTGIDTNDTLIEACMEENKIKDCRGFLDDPNDITDEHGHGTHVTRLILELAPSAEVYVAKVSNSLKIASNKLGSISKVSLSFCLSLHAKHTG